MGDVYYFGRRDYRRALEEYQAGLRGAPNDVTLAARIRGAHVLLGDWDSLGVEFDRASRIDPRNVDLFMDRGNLLHYLRRYRAS